MKTVIRCAAVALLAFACSAAAFGQWSSNPALNLALADNNNGSDQVQPKLLPAKNGWLLSWFDANPATSVPVGYDVFFQRLGNNGAQKFQHGGIMVADLTNSSTEDYGLDADSSGNALIAFLDTRESGNQQVTAARISPAGKELWGSRGVQLTSGSTDFHGDPKIVGTSDGNVVVGWTNNNEVVLQKLNSTGQPQWGSGVVISNSSYSFFLADMHAADNGSVIISMVQEQGFGSDAQLRANKIAADGSLMWGSGNVTVFDTGSLQFGNFPYFIYDGNGGAVFAWYTSIPTLQCFAQHILADGSEAFPHNGSPVSSNSAHIRVEPTASYEPSTGEVYIFWTEEDALQVYNGVSGQKFSSSGAPEWSSTGKIIVPLGLDQQIWVTPVTVGDGVLAVWVDQVAFGSATIEGIKLSGSGATICPQFPVSSTPANKSRLVAAIASSGITAVAFEDDHIGNNGIYIQNVNRNCTLGHL